MKVKLKAGRKDIVVSENVVDRVIRYFSPIKGQQRLKARTMTALAGGYDGASRSKRSLSSWSTRGADADSNLLPDLADLRDRSFDLYNNSPLAAGAINTAVTSVVGSGLKLKSVVDGDFLKLSDEQASEWERKAERLFNFFAGREHCDITRTQTFEELQDLVFRSTLTAGDIFTLLPYKKFNGSPFQLKIQLVEGHRVCNKDNLRNTNRMAGGVELDDKGAPVNYHILKSHPGNLYSMQRNWAIVPAFGKKTGRRNVLHNFRRLRPGQNRGAPYLAPVIETLKQLERYTEAELMAAVVSGMFTVFVKSESDEELDIFEPNSETGGSASDDDYKLGNGAIVQLGADDDIETANPGRPNTAFDPFVLSILRQVGVALEIPYEILIKHFTASYSAARTSLLEAWRFFLARRQWLASSFCQPVYEAFIDEQVAAGRLTAPGYFRDPLIRQAYLGTRWTGRPQGQIDPKKENEADAIAEDRGWKTAEENTAEKTGGDWEQKHKQRAKEEKMRREAGLSAKDNNQQSNNVDNNQENMDKPDENT